MYRVVRVKGHELVCDGCTERYTETSASLAEPVPALCDSRADVSNQLAILGLNEYVKFRYNELFHACLEL